jgi:TM2 domain-containing membrane protein YozV
MKKTVFLFLVLAISVMFGHSAKASGYVADDKAIDAMFAAAPETVNATFADLNMAGTSTVSMASSGKEASIALILDFFLGGLGVHRFYLGTEVLTGVGYILTCGGIFGIVPLVDFVVLIINYNDISRYVDNPKFFMWN